MSVPDERGTAPDIAASPAAVSPAAAPATSEHGDTEHRRRERDASRRPMRADARRNYERLVATAAELFAEQGTDAPFDEIATRAGVGSATLYRHFPTRGELIEAVYNEQIVALGALAGSMIQQYEPWDALANWMRAQLDLGLGKRGLVAGLKASIERESDAFARCHDIMRSAADEVLDNAIAHEAIRPDVDAMDLLRLGHGVLVASEKASPHERERMLSVVLDGLRAN